MRSDVNAKPEKRVITKSLYSGEVSVVMAQCVRPPTMAGAIVARKQFSTVPEIFELRAAWTQAHPFC